MSLHCEFPFSFQQDEAKLDKRASLRGETYKQTIFQTKSVKLSVEAFKDFVRRKETEFQLNGYLQSLGARMTKGIGIEDFNKVKVLGRGAYGKVILGENKQTKELIAIKILKKKEIDENDEGHIVLNEVDLLESTNHQFIVKKKCLFQDKSRIYIGLEFMKGGELFQHIRISGRFDENS